ncbi:amidase family protein [Microbacterium sp. NPDC076911]|uniref:amidase n=1 Tax=Microbacterium sp. NPDC076911 TaxID=3154958 RepID=UPI0034496346
MSPTSREPVHTPRTAREIAGAVRAAQLSAVDVMQSHLSHIAAINDSINAVTAIFADRSLAAAREIDEAVSAGLDPGPLAGVPFTVKENIDLTWSATTNGWRGAVDYVAPDDAVIVSRMRAAGAVPIGRGNMSDFGMRWDTDNELFGRTLNPWDFSRTAGGSSGGDAVAVATGMSVLGLGNDFGGSLRIPAHAAGVCAIRPSFGRVPRSAVRGAPVAMTLQQFSVNGPIARNIADLELAFQVLLGSDPRDGISVDADAVDLDGAPRRVGVVKGTATWDVEPGVSASINKAVDALIVSGWDVVEIELPRLEEAATLWRRLACTDMLFTFDPADLSVPLGDAATAFMRDSTAAARPYETTRDYAGAWAQRVVVAAEWRQLQQDTPLILGPVLASGIPAVDFDLGGQSQAAEAWRSLWLTLAANFLGLPAIAVPTGLDAASLPTGVQVIGPMNGDELALRAARDIETECVWPGVPR